MSRNLKSVPEISREFTSLIRILDQRFGDGTVYLTQAEDKPLYALAVSMQLIDISGLITPGGRRFLTRFEDGIT